MDTAFSSSGSSQTSDPHEINLKRSDKYIAFLSLSICYTWKNIKKSYKNNIFNISAPTWNEEVELPDRSYYVSDIQDYFKYIWNKHKTVADNLSIKIDVKKIENGK